MWMIIVGAIVNLLIFFFQEWWKKNNPVVPDEAARTAFLSEVMRPRYIWMGPKRRRIANKLFDKFAAKVSADPVKVSDGPLSEDDAEKLVAHYANQLTLSESEAM